MKNDLIPRFKLITSMVIFGTIGIFVSYIPLSRGMIAFVRGAVGALCLLIYAFFSKTPLVYREIKQNLLLLVLSGGAIGFNWVFLFEAYGRTTIATATLCYYMAPVIVMLASPFILKERLTVKKAVCIAVALAGMVLVSGVISGAPPKPDELLGIVFGLIAAALYASVIIMNKKMKEISAHNRTTLQLAFAALVVLPYTLLAERPDLSVMTHTAWVLLALVGVLHTGVAYLLYFGSMKELPAQTVAIFSYTDPAIAIILSAVVLLQPMDVAEIIGAVLIILSALISDISLKKAKKEL